MRRYEGLRKRIAKLQPESEWVDSDSDGFLGACGALPGETAADALRRTAAADWGNYGN